MQQKICFGKHSKVGEPMAVTSIWSITSRVDSVIDYVSNPEKTIAQESDMNAALHTIDDVVEYAVDDLKTEERVYVSGIRCDPEFAARQFQKTKQHYKKTGGILAFHGYQSFKPGEVDADTAHRIGVELAKELWGDRFEVVVATHLNTDHYHNHFVINSVSIVDGYRYYDNKETYRRMREVSDRLCKAHQLSVIKNPGGKGKSYAEWSAEKNGKPTYRGMVKADIDRAILASTTMRDFYRVMEQMGYTFKLRKKNGQPLAHPVAVPPGGGNGVRMDGLGEEYTLDGITQRILRNMRKRIPFPEAENRRLGRYRYRGNFKKSRKATGLRALYFYYCYRLKIIVKHPASTKKVLGVLREDIIQLDKRIAETRFLGKYKIETADDLAGRKQYADTQIEVLTDQRKDLRNALKRITRKGNAAEIEATKEKISALTDELIKLRKEVKLCDSIAERSGLVKEGLEAIIEQDTSERKEKNQYEHSRRRSGTDRQNVTQWR